MAEKISEKILHGRLFPSWINNIRDNNIRRICEISPTANDGKRSKIGQIIWHIRNDCVISAQQISIVRFEITPKLR